MGLGGASQLCELCRQGPAFLEYASEGWHAALWTAEKYLLHCVQPLVCSPILDQYAQDAYHLRQKPWGWCCDSCKEWVWQQVRWHKTMETAIQPVSKVWPRLGEACLSGPKYFPLTSRTRSQATMKGCPRMQEGIRAEMLRWTRCPQRCPAANKSESRAGCQRGKDRMDTCQGSRKGWGTEPAADSPDGAV